MQQNLPHKVTKSSKMLPVIFSVMHNKLKFTQLCEYLLQIFQNNAKVDRNHNA